jgi:hypothetical protein
MFITAFTSARHVPPSWTRSIQSVPLHPVLEDPLLSSHLRLGLPSGLFPFSPPKPCVHLSVSPIQATCPAHHILFVLITRVIFSEQYRSWSSMLCSLLHCPFTSSLLGPNILLSACPFFSVRDHVSHPYETSGKQRWWKWEIKVSFSPCVIKMCGGSDGIHPRVLKFSIGRRYVVSFTSRPLYHRIK